VVGGGVPSLLRCRGVGDGGAASRTASASAARGAAVSGSAVWRGASCRGVVGVFDDAGNAGFGADGAVSGGWSGWRRVAASGSGLDDADDADVGPADRRRERLRESGAGGVGKWRPGVASMTRATLGSAAWMAAPSRGVGSGVRGETRAASGSAAYLFFPLRLRPAVASGSSGVAGLSPPRRRLLWPRFSRPLLIAGPSSRRFPSDAPSPPFLSTSPTSLALVNTLLPLRFVQTSRDTLYFPFLTVLLPASTH
jgi:hypothetical protein